MRRIGLGIITMFFLWGVFISLLLADDFSAWGHRSTLTLSSATPSPSYKVRLVLNAASFSYSALSFPATGKDLRFSDASSNGANLKYYIETWDNAGKSIVWVDVPTQGTSSLYMFYGNEAATDVSSTAFADTFPSRLVVTANTSLSLDSGVRSYDWIDIQSGATLTQVTSANYDVLKLISKSKIKVVGTIVGVGNHAGGTGTSKNGQGRGGSQGDTWYGIGGSYGGSGGRYDGATGTIGSTYDVSGPNIESGSGGSSGIYSPPSYVGTGGAGGGGILLQSQFIDVAGTINCNGAAGISNTILGAGGGSGGGILLRANTISGSGSLLARGGSKSDFGAGDGGGGRIKLFYSSYSSGLTTSVAVGGDTSGIDPVSGTVVTSTNYALTVVQPTFIAELPTVYTYEAWSTKNSVAVSWASAPTPSDVAYYQISLGTSAGDASIVNWVQNSGTSVNLDTTNLLTYGDRYFVNVRAVTVGGATANVSYQFQLVDPTAPTTPSINSSIRYTSSNATVVAKWGGSTDPETGIQKYQVSLGSVRGVADLSAWQDASESARSFTMSNLTLTPGQTYYVNVRAYNGVSMESLVASYDVKVDTSASTTPAVTNTYGYLTSTSNVPIQWTNATDETSGILRHEISVGTLATDQGNWRSISGTPTTTITTLINGETYYAKVRAINGALIVSPISSFGFIVDVTAPGIPTVNSTYSYLSSSSDVPIKWDAPADSQSGILRYEVSVGEIGNRTSILDWTSEGMSTSTTRNGLNLTSGTQYYASVRAVNNAGLISSVSSFNFVVDTTAPSVPTVSNTYTYSSNTSTVPVKWLASTDTLSGLVRYEVALGVVGDRTSLLGWTSVGTATEVTHNINLTNGTRYYASVRAVNGAGTASAVSSFNFFIDTTGPSKPTVTNEYTYLTSQTDVPIKWLASSDSESGISMYQVALGTSGGATNNVNFMAVGSGTAVTLNGLSLENGTRYWASVRAINGSGAVSSVASFNFKVDVTAASVPTVSNTYGYLTTLTDVPIEWVESADSESNVTGYEVSVGTTAGGVEKRPWEVASGVSATILNTGLTNGTAYYANARSVNGAGLKSAASSFRFVADITAPSVPTVSNTYSYLSSTSNVPVSWAVATDNQSIVTGYEVSIGTSAGAANTRGWQSVSGTSNTVTTALNNGGTFYANVRAVNGAGLKSSISSFSFLVDNMAPSVPTVSNTYSYLTSTSNVPIRWSAAADAQSGVTGYEVSIGSSAGATDNVSWTSVAGLATTVNTTLTQGNIYYANVRSVNGGGAKSSVSSFSFKVDVTVPSVPTASHTYSYLTSASAVPIKWTAATDSQSSVSGYEVSVGTSAGNATIQNWASASGTSAAMNTSLTNGSVYYANVRAINGAGLKSGISSFSFKVDTTTASVPTVNTTYSYLTSTSNVAIKWGASTDSESGLARYEVALGINGNRTSVSDWTTVATTNVATTFNSLSLVNGTRYYASVRAVNDAGLTSTVSSFNFVVDTTSPSVPVVSSPYQYLASTSNVPIQWGIGSTDSESGIGSYQVSLGTTLGASNTVGWTTVSALATTLNGLSLTNGTRYYANVRAINGAGLISSVSSFNFKVDSTVPNVPTISNTYAYLASSSAVPIKWGASTDGESGVVRYEVALGVTGNRTSVVGWTTTSNLATTLNRLSLENGARYYASVRAINGAGLISSVSSFNFKVDTTAASAPALLNTYAYLTSVTTIPIEWSSSADSESAVTGYEVSIGTSVGAVNTRAWQFVGGTSYTFGTTGINLPLTNGGTYYANVRAVNGAGLKSSISSFSFKADVTSPTTPLVQNTYAYLASSTTVPIVWTAGIDGQSGILRYEISVGTDGTDQGNWVSSVGLSDKVVTAMTNGGTYYGKVRAVNGAGLISDISSFSFIVDTTAPSVPTVSHTYDYLISSTTVPIKWGASADSESGVVRYEVALGVSGNQTSVTGWTTVASANLATTLNSLSLVNGTRYYASVRAVNVVGLVSSVSSFNFMVDTNAPSKPILANTYGYLASTSTVPIRWAAAIDAESGVSLYEIALGTSLGATNNVNWTSVGVSDLATTLNGLSLTNGTRYYASVRAANNAGLISSISSFNFKVDVTEPSVPTVSNTYAYLTSTSNVPISWVAATDSQSDVSEYEVSVGEGAWHSVSGTTATVNTVLVNGNTYSAAVRAINGAGLKSTISSFNFVVDVTAPSVPTVSNTYEYLASSSIVPIKWGSSADSQSGVLRYEVSLGTVSDRTSALDWTSVESATETTRNGLSLTNGTRYYASVRAVNNAGLASSVSSFNFMLDTTLPSVPTVTNTYSYLTSTSNVPIRWLAAVDAESVVSGYEVSIGTSEGATDNVNWTSVSGFATTVNTTLTQGSTYYANVRAVNSGGGKSGVSSFGFKVDVTVPSVPTVSNTYSYLTSSSAVPIRWATATDAQSDVSGYEVSVGGSVWTSASGMSATVNTTLVNGTTYSVFIRSVNGAGLKSTASSFSFKVDTTGPSVPTVSNTFSYRTVTDTVPVSWAVATDNQSVVSGYEVSIGTSGGAADVLSWQLVSGVSTMLNTSLTNGDRYYVNVRSVNLAGLKSGISSFNFMVDTTVPSAPTISTSYAYRTSNTVPFSWVAATDSQSDVSGYEVSIGTSAGATNNANWASISGTSATVNTTLTNGGVYYANVRAINAAGLKSGVSSFSFIADSTAPSVPTISTTYGYLSSLSDVPISWAAASDSQSDVTGYEVSVGGDEWRLVSGTSVTVNTTLVNGTTYSAFVRSVNGAGLKSTASSFSFKVDTTGPSVPTVSNIYAYRTVTDSVPVSWAIATDNESLVTEYEVSVGTAATDQGNWVSVSGVSANVTTTLTNGSVYYAKVRSVNGAGLKSPISSFSFKVDTTVPNVPTVASTYSYLTSATTVPIVWTAATDVQSSVSEYEVSVGTAATDQGNWVSASGVSANVTILLTNGSTYYAKVRAINGAGLKSSISSFSFKVDITAPSVPTVSTTYAYLTSATTVPIVWTAATDGQSVVTGYEVSVGTAATDQGGWISVSGVSTNVTTTLTNGGTYYAKVRSVNAAGLKSSISSFSFKVDTTAPSAPTITNTYDYLASISTVPIQWRASIENESGVLRYEVALGTNGNRTGILDWTSMGTSLATTRNSLNLVSGSQYFVSVRAVNNAGLISTISSFNFIADTSLPSKPMMTGYRPYVVSLRMVPIAWVAATDDQSGISGYEVSVGNTGGDQGGWTSVSALSTALTVPTLNNGSVYYAKVRAVNGAGLKSGLASFSFRVDVTAPLVPTVSNTFSYLTSRTKVPLSWAESSDRQSDVSRYDISVGTVTGNEGTWTSAGLVLSTIATVPTLNNGGTYYGKVRAINGAGGTSNISWFGFVVDNTVPSVPTVSRTYTYLNSLTTVPISWAAATDAQTAVTGYEVSIGTSRGATDTVEWTSVSGTSTTLNTTLINGGFYFVNVRAINAAGLKSGISSFNFMADITAPSVPTAASTYAYLTSRTLVPIRWTAATDSQSLVTGYEISVSTANGNGGTWTSVTGTATTVNVSLTNGAYYYAKVRAVNGVGLVSELSSFRFMVDTTAPSVPKLSDASRFAKSATTAVISWLASTDGESGVSRYEVSFGSQSGGSNLKGWASVGVTTSATLTGLNLLPGQLYFANLRAVNEAGLISTSDSRGVVLPDATPTADASPISYSFDYADNGVAMSLRTSLGVDKVILYQVLSPDAPLDHLSLTTQGVHVYTGPIVITRDAVVISVAVFSADLKTRLYESAYDVTLFDEDEMHDLLQNGPVITITQPAPLYTLYAEMDVPVGTTLWYTLDGRQPTVGVGTLYKGRPISVLPGAVIKSIIFWDGQVSIVSSFSVPNLPEKAVFVQAPRYISTISNLAFSWSLSDRSLDMFYMIGTTPLGSDVVAKTGVSSLSVALSALHLQDTTMYYVSVGSGKTGDVFSLATFNVTVDTTPASIPVVVAQVKRLDSELVSVPMSWTEALDTISGVTRYEVSIGSRSGADDVVHWQSVSLARSVTIVDLAIGYERIYYANVRAINGSGLISIGSSRILTPDNAETTGQFNMDHTISNENVSDYVAKDFYVGYDKPANLTTLTDLHLNNVIVGKKETGIGSVLLGSPTASILVSGNFLVGDEGRGTVVQSAGEVTILGTLTLGSPRSASSSYTLSAGSLVTDTLYINAANGSLVFTGGELSLRRLVGSLTNGGGVFIVDLRQGAVRVSGSYTQGSTSELRIIVKPISTVSTSIYSSSIYFVSQERIPVFALSQFLRVAGILDVQMPGLEPKFGMKLQILDVANMAGTFSTIRLPDLPSSLRWDVSELYTTGMIKIVGSGAPPKLVGSAFNYPNPFRADSGTSIGYELDQPLDISVYLYTIRGNLVKKWTFNAGEPGGAFGYNTVAVNRDSLDGQDLRVGVYMYVVTHGTQALGKGKMVVQP